VHNAPPRPRLADHSRDLDDSDEIAALDAIRIALTEVGDGSSYVWHRENGRISGVVHPTASFKDRTGRVCRHIVVVLTTGFRTGRVEGIACRLGDGTWQLEG
jgi:surface antigen